MTQISASLPPYVVNSSGLQVYDHIGALCRIIADGRMTGGAYSIVEERGRAGFMSPRHVHQREAETFIVLSGELEGWTAGTLSRVTEGNLVYLPANLEHAFRIVSPSAHFLTLITPAGFETFFEDSGVPLEQPFSGELLVPGPLSQEEGAALQAILSPLGCTITGPPPFAAD